MIGSSSEQAFAWNRTIIEHWLLLTPPACSLDGVDDVATQSCSSSGIKLWNHTLNSRQTS